MPLWHIYHPPNTYSDEDKAEFAQAITEIYTGVGLPAFYAVVLFKEIDRSSFYVGGTASDDTVRIVVEHLARHLDDPVLRERSTRRLNAVMEPFTRDRGLHWEFHTYESPRDLWMIAGQFPPLPGSDGEKIWVAANKPVPL